MIFTNPYWSIKQKVNTLQRYILVHSYLYYEADKSIITDKQFDSNAKQLVELQNELGSLKQTEYGYAFKGFDGTTGFDLYGKLNNEDKVKIKRISMSVHRTYRLGN